MPGKIFIASKGVFLPNNLVIQHLYLVYAEDGDITDESSLYVIRGGPNYGLAQQNGPGNLFVEIDIPLSQSADAYNTLIPIPETYLTRGTVEVNIGDKNARYLWEDFIESAKNLNSSSYAILNPPPISNGSITCARFDLLLMAAFLLIVHNFGNYYELPT